MAASTWVVLGFKDDLRGLGEMWAMLSAAVALVQSTSFGSRRDSLSRLSIQMAARWVSLGDTWETGREAVTSTAQVWLRNRSLKGAEEGL